MIKREFFPFFHIGVSYRDVAIGNDMGNEDYASKIENAGKTTLKINRFLVLLCLTGARISILTASANPARYNLLAQLP